MGSNKANISPVISPDILKVISASTAIKTFGSQLKDKTKETLIVGNQTKTADIDQQIEDLNQKEIQAGETLNTTIQTALYKFDTYQVTQDQYNDIIFEANLNYNLTIKAIDIQRLKLEQDKDNIENNPYKKIKDNQNNIKKEIQKLKKQTQTAESKAKADLTKQVVSNIAKNLAPVIALQLTNQFFNLISQRKKLEILVDQVNNYINTQVKDQTTVTIATNLRNNAITLINNNIEKLNQIKKTLDKINKILLLFSAIVVALNLAITLFPPLTPPGIVKKIIDAINKASILIVSINVILAIANTILGNEISKLKELRDRLKEVSLKLDGKILDNLDSQQLSDLSNSIVGSNNQFPPYKGFNFKIKEEQNQAFVVKGNKRHYAVAVDRYNVEIVKSDYSFTLDPQDLVDQLKLVIDQQNLQG